MPHDSYRVEIEEGSAFDLWFQDLVAREPRAAERLLLAMERFETDPEGQGEFLRRNDRRIVYLVPPRSAWDGGKPFRLLVEVDESSGTAVPVRMVEAVSAADWEHEIRWIERRLGI